MHDARDFPCVKEGENINHYACSSALEKVTNLPIDPQADARSLAIRWSIIPQLHRLVMLQQATIKVSAITAQMKNLSSWKVIKCITLIL